ncbi:hypothetical protein CIB48_g282 [Xylaria polymorpha]|nr:hypothetical protein CIB48_g282 [Xylaria polymorpha]
MDSNTPSSETRKEDGLAEMLSSIYAELQNIQQQVQEFINVICTIRNMFEDLSEKDVRFISLKGAADHFLVENSGVKDRLDHLLSHEQTRGSGTPDIIPYLKPLLHLSNMMNSCLSTNGDTVLIRGDLLLQMEDLLMDEVDAAYNSIDTTDLELLVFAIFELLNISEIPLTVQEIPKERTPSAYLDFLGYLYTRTKNIDLGQKPQPPSTGQAAPQPSEPEHGNALERKKYDHVYRTNLDATTDQVRVVELLPGSGEYPIMCSLKVCTIDNIEEALSFALMRHIYGKAKKTTIWLHDNQRPWSDVDEIKFSTPLPAGFGGTTMNEYDLVSILKEIQEHESSNWNIKKIALLCMLYRCVKQVLSHEWWTRIWTLQEGALPPSPPIFFFRGHSFSFNELRDSIDLINKSGGMDAEEFRVILGQIADNSEEGTADSCAEIESLAYALSRIPELTLLFDLRPREGKARDKNLNLFYVLLLQTNTYNATCPEDKIFALESLLPQSTGNLILPDYGESCELIFRRTTARYYNALHTLNGMENFSLRFESTTRTISALSGPSWVLDFSFSDASIHTNSRADKVTDTVTLSGFILHNASTRFKFAESKASSLLFATPTTLFCTGISIDRIYQAGIIPSLVEGNELPILMDFANGIDEQSQPRLEAEGLLRPLDDPRAEDSSRSPFRTLMLFFMHLDDEMPRGDTSEFWRKRFKELSGKAYYFITERGLVGIATCPV